MRKLESEIWFAMRATYRRELEIKALLESSNIDTFIPMRYELQTKGKQKRRQLVPVIHNLIFVYAIPSQLQVLKKDIGHLQYMTDSRSGEKIIIPEDQMKRFIAVAGTYNESLLYFNPETLNLAKGTKVRICGGEFEGQEGVFIKVKGARDRRVVIEIQGVIAVAIAAIHPDLIEIIEKPTTVKRPR